VKTRTLVLLAIALAFITTFSLYVSYAQTPMLIANAKKIVASITAPVQHLIHASLSGGTRITQEIDETKRCGWPATRGPRRT